MSGDGSEQCNRNGCDGTATSRLSISADYDEAMTRTERVCIDCIEELGEWFRGELNVE